MYSQIPVGRRPVYNCVYCFKLKFRHLLASICEFRSRLTLYKWVFSASIQRLRRIQIGLIVLFFGLACENCTRSANPSHCSTEVKMLLKYLLLLFIYLFSTIWRKKFLSVWIWQKKTYTPSCFLKEAISVYNGQNLHCLVSRPKRLKMTISLANRPNKMKP